MRGVLTRLGFFLLKLAGWNIKRHYGAIDGYTEVTWK